MALVLIAVGSSTLEAVASSPGAQSLIACFNLAPGGAVLVV